MASDTASAMTRTIVNLRMGSFELPTSPDFQPIDLRPAIVDGGGRLR
jgi:hypothetical protein